jgi:hypothetical protein
LSDKVEENEIDESRDIYERRQKYLLDFEFFWEGGGGEGGQNEGDHREHPVR